jgi:hypothetical protein
MSTNHSRFASFHRLLAIFAVTAFVCVGADNAFARPSYGGDCSGCHTHTPTGTLSITGNTGTGNVATRLDNGSTAILKMFTVQQGQSIGLSITDTSSNPMNVAVTGTVDNTGTLTSMSAIPGVKKSLNDILNFTADPLWTPQNDGAGTTWYSDSALSGSKETFNLLVNANTLPDVYSLTLRAAGRPSSSTAWAQSEEILINVTSATAPEPSTIVMFLGAGIGLACVKWRKRRKAC